MKKLLFSIAAAAAMLVSCSEKEITVPETGSGEPFSFHASILADKAQDTKTTLTIEGTAEEPQYKVAWDEGDQLSVVAVYADGSRQAYQFTKGDGDIFSCESVENPGDIKALNVFYPYDKNQHDMDGEYGRAGMSFGMNAVQNGTDDAAHIDGPLYGYAQVADGQASVAMAHASTLFDIQVVNEGNSDISVSKISMTAGEKTYLMGWFQINPQTGALKLGTTKYYTSELNVTDGTVGAGKTGHFYITAAPFSMTSGSELTVTVTASGKDYIVKKSIERNVTFAAGKVNHVTNVAVSPEPSLSLSTTCLATTVSSGEIPLQVYAYGNWTATADGTEGWLELDKTEGNGDATVMLTLAEPESDSEFHTGTITFVNGDLTETLTIQHGYAQKINDHIWAKANVGEPGRFASSPDAQGLYYQYNSKTGYPGSYPSTTGPAPSGIVLAPAYPVYTSWEEENDPCPEGWRVPTREEVQALFGTDGNERFVWMAEDAAATAGFACPGAVCGTDKASGGTAVSSNMNGCIFLPCAGNLRKQNGTYQNPQNATMNTSTFHPAGEGQASSVAGRYIIRITSQTDYTLASSKWGWDDPDASYPVRCIADTK